MASGSGWRSWLGWLLAIWLLSTLGFGWLLQSLAVLLGLLILLPVVAVGLGLGLGQWWLRTNLVTDTCPVCQGEFTAPRTAAVNCPYCGETLTVAGQRFTRYTPPGTIEVEVQAIE